MVKSRRRASCSAVPKTLSWVMRRSVFGVPRPRPPPPRRLRPSATPALQLGGVGAEGGDLDDLPALEVDVREPEPAADEPAVAEDGAHLARVGAGGDVEVLGRAPQQQVADAAADEVSLVSVRVQPEDDLERVGIELVGVDLRGPARRGRLGDERRLGEGILGERLGERLHGGSQLFERGLGNRQHLEGVHGPGLQAKRLARDDRAQAGVSVQRRAVFRWNLASSRGG